MAVPKSEFEKAMRERNALEDKLLVKAWQDETFKKQLVKDPSGVIAKEIGQEFPAGCKYEVIEEAPNTLELVLPRKPQPVQASEELSDEALQGVAGGGKAIIAGGNDWNFVLFTSGGSGRYFVAVG